MKIETRILGLIFDEIRHTITRVAVQTMIPDTVAIAAMMETTLAGLDLVNLAIEMTDS